MKNSTNDLERKILDRAAELEDASGIISSARAVLMDVSRHFATTDKKELRYIPEISGQLLHQMYGIDTLLDTFYEKMCKSIEAIYETFRSNNPDAGCISVER